MEIAAEKDFSDILRNLMKERKFTQTKLAELMDIKQSQISEWLSGKAQPGYDNLRKLAQVFEVSADYLLMLTDY